MKKFRLGLAAKVAVCVIFSTAAFFALFGYINLRSERRHFQEQVEQSAARVANVIVGSTHYEMLKNDPDALKTIVSDLGSEKGIQRIRILNPQGRIVYSSDAQEMRQSAGPVDVLVSSASARYFVDTKGNRVLSVARTVENGPECYRCHDRSQRLLGVIDAQLSLAEVDRDMARHQANLTWFLVGATVFGCVAAVGFMWSVVYRPVKELMDGTHRVAGGDLEYRLPVRSDDELGDLARSFNQMTAEVGGIQSKIEDEVKRKTAELERVHKTLLRSEKLASIGKLAATVAHEINNPLFGILTYSRLVSREVGKHELPGREELLEQLQTIERESKRCGDLVKNLLTFSRQAPSHREPNDLNTVVHRAVLLVKHKLEMQNIELVETLDPSLSPVECDANQMQQVILVLMMNAAEAMPKGGRLEVATSTAGAQNSVLVKDSGCGIPEDVLPRIFDPFFTTKEDQLRTGLGLAVAHSIVEQHTGEISVHSKPGEGTEFRVLLPAAAAAPAEVHQ
ncbi:MAG TPA: ATP-binding protein [Verrucomicrobiae bacterium]|nr:ATP-binding protein [Verrucomicrobiae bacterium]